jgi:hypothetical protein
MPSVLQRKMPSTCGSSGEQALCNHPVMSDENVRVLESRYGAGRSMRPLGPWRRPATSTRRRVTVGP